MDAVDNFLLIERPDLVAASAKSLARRRRELFVVDHIDHDAGTLRGVLDGQRRTFTMSAMGPDLRRITMQENENGLESLARVRRPRRSDARRVVVVPHPL